MSLRGFVPGAFSVGRPDTASVIGSPMRSKKINSVLAWCATVSIRSSVLRLLISPVNLHTFLSMSTVRIGLTSHPFDTIDVDTFETQVRKAVVRIFAQPP